MKFRLTKEEKSWVFYDVGNSAFTLMVSTILPIYFNYLGEKAGLSDSQYLAYWGYAISLATLVIVFFGPVLGTLADTKGFKKPIFFISFVVGAVACVLSGATSHWLMFLILFFVAKVGYSASLIFYDSMLVDVTTEE